MSSRRARHSRLMRVAESLDARRLLSTTLFSTGFEAAQNGTSFTSYNYAANTNLTGLPTSPPANTVRFTSLVTPDITGSSGSATVYTYASSNIKPSGSNTQYVGLSDLNGIGTTSDAFYFPNLPSITPNGAGTPVVDIFATIGILQGQDHAAFGLTALDGTPSPHQNVVADLQVDATTGGVTVDEGTKATGFTQSVSTGVSFVSYELELNYASQTYSAYEGASATSLVAIATNVPFETAATTFSTGAIDTESLATTGRSTGYALFDDLAITASAAPVTQLTGTTYGTAGSYGNVAADTIAAATDGNLNTFFDAPTASGGTVGIDLGSAKVVSAVKFAPRANFASRMVGGVFQVSTSKTFSSNVITVYTITAAPASGVLTTVTPSTTSAYEYWRYYGPANGYCDIAEFQLFGSSTTPTPTPSPTPTRLTGTTYGTAGSYGNIAADTIAAATDGNLNTFFDAPMATGGNVGIDLGSAKVVTQIKFAPRAGFASRMVGGEFQVSTSMTFSSNVTTVYTITSAPVSGSLTTINLSLGTAYRYWRYIGPANGYCDIAEFELFG